MNDILKLVAYLTLATAVVATGHWLLAPIVHAHTSSMTLPDLLVVLELLAVSAILLSLVVGHIVNVAKMLSTGHREPESARWKDMAYVFVAVAGSAALYIAAIQLLGLPH